MTNQEGPASAESKQLQKHSVLVHKYHISQHGDWSSIAMRLKGEIQGTWCDMMRCNAMWWWPCAAVCCAVYCAVLCCAEGSWGLWVVSVVENNTHSNTQPAETAVTTQRNSSVWTDARSVSVWVLVLVETGKCAYCTYKLWKKWKRYPDTVMLSVLYTVRRYLMLDFVVYRLG
jgi:hypothetical protein